MAPEGVATKQASRLCQLRRLVKRDYEVSSLKLCSTPRIRQRRTVADDTYKAEAKRTDYGSGQPEADDGGQTQPV